MGFSNQRRCHPELLLESRGEMGQVLEPYFQIDLRRLFVVGLQQGVGFFQTALHNPAVRCFLVGFGEVALEGGEASAGVVGKLLHGEVAHEVLVHELLQIGLPLLLEVEEEAAEGGLQLQYHQDGFVQFRFHQFFGGVLPHAEVLVQ